MREVYSVERVLEVNTEFQCVIGVHLRPLGFAILVVISPVGYVLATPNPTIGSWERLVALIRNTLSMIIKLSCDLGIEKRSEAGGVHGAAFVEIDYAESILLASAGVGCSKVEPLRVVIGVGVVFQDEGSRALCTRCLPLGPGVSYCNNNVWHRVYTGETASSIRCLVTVFGFRLLFTLERTPRLYSGDFTARLWRLLALLHQFQHV